MSFCSFGHSRARKRHLGKHRMSSGANELMKGASCTPPSLEHVQAARAKELIPSAPCVPTGMAHHPRSATVMAIIVAIIRCLQNVVPLEKAHRTLEQISVRIRIANRSPLQSLGKMVAWRLYLYVVHISAHWLSRYSTRAKGLLIDKEMAMQKRSHTALEKLINVNKSEKLK